MNRIISYLAAAIAACIMLPFIAVAQTDADAIMMGKQKFCTGFLYSHSQWNKYWEGTLHRKNENIGTVTTTGITYMGSYGLTRKINLIAGLPFIQTAASAGTMKGQSGIQDASLMMKWKAVTLKKNKRAFSAFAIAGASTPVSNYVVDYLPLSIGMGSRTFFLRGMADYQLHRFFITGAASYHRRSNVKIDRQAYYTTEMHYTNEVQMPDAGYFLFRTGYRTSELIAELTADRWITLGGFDIRRNDMPFPSNRMNMARLGVNVKYEPRWFSNLSLTAGGSHTVAGRNIGQNSTFYGGIFYIFDLRKKASSSPSNALNN